MATTLTITSIASGDWDNIDIWDKTVTGTCDGTMGDNLTLQDAALTQASGYWVTAVLIITGGTNVGETRIITGFNATTDTLSWASAMPAPCDATTTYKLGFIPENNVTYVYTVVIAHTVTETTSHVIGTTPTVNTTYNLTINNGAKLTVAGAASSDITLTMQGNVRVLRGGTMIVGSESAGGLASDRKATLYFQTSLETTANWRVYCSGTFRALGCEGYHMLAPTLQRSKLSSDIAGGGSATFDLLNPVNWQVNDYICVGIGGKKDDGAFPVNDTAERVQITGKTDSNTFTATFTNAHKTNDFVFLVDRNVILKGDNATGKGFQLVFEPESTTVGTNEVVCNLEWARILYGGVSTSPTVYYYIHPANKTALLTSSNLTIKNCVFDQSGGTRSSGIATGTGVLIDVDNFFDTDLFTGIYCNHSWDMANMYEINSVGRFQLEKITSIYNQGADIAATAGSTELFVKEHWYEGRRSNAASYSALYGFIRSYLDSEIHNGVYVMSYVSAPTDIAHVAPMEIKNLKCYHLSYTSGTIAINMTNSPAPSVDVNIINCEFRKMTGAAFNIGNAMRVFISGCSFDDMGSLLEYVLDLNYTGGGVLDQVRATVDNCTFGTVVRNNVRNIRTGTYSNDDESFPRIILNECEFVEPIGWDNVGTYSWYTRSQIWSCFPHSAYDWRNHLYPVKFALEWNNCIVWNAGKTADQFVTDYGSGRTHLVVTHGGGESLNEPAGGTRIDGSFARKIRPLCPWENMMVNGARPIRFAVGSGKVVKCKLSFKKSGDGSHGLPGLRLMGPGIWSEAFTTPGNTDWEQLTVQGTTDAAGLCELYVFGGSNEQSGDPTFEYSWGPPDGGCYTSYKITVYADGLLIGVV